jgi:conjugative transfer signal peptidase TraF
MMVSNRQPLVAMEIVFILLATGWFIQRMTGTRYYINLTRSEPIGIYRLIPGDVRRLKTGDLVIMDVPRQARRYIYGRRWLREGWPLLKNIGAVAGDTYCITDSTVRINGQYLGPVFRTDGQGRELPRLRGTFQVEAGQFLPVSVDHAQSFDGRYFGAVSCGLIRGRAIAVLTF